jgi:phosphoribosylglycinamide formyltransferase-1
MKNIAIFASGNGTNAQRISEYFFNSDKINISLILSNKKDAYVLERAKKMHISSFLFNKKELNDTNIVIKKLKEYKIDFIVLAGFMIKIPENILKIYANKIINIHPALLPKYGGKGMYGLNVHKAVINAKETETGITIHIVDDNYDKGKIIFQAKCRVDNNDTPESLANKVHLLEYEFYPKMIKKIVCNTDVIN